LYLRAMMFNKKAANIKYRSGKVIESISLNPGMKIADIGAGGGYFSLRFAEMVAEEGKVYAVDTNPNYLEYIRTGAIKKGLTNIITVLSQGPEIDIPEKSLDFVFMRNVTHHIPDRISYFERLKDLLKPGGRAVIIEYEKGKSNSFHRMFSHYVEKNTIKQEMKRAGYNIYKEYGFLPGQHFTIFSQE